MALLGAKDLRPVLALWKWSRAMELDGQRAQDASHRVPEATQTEPLASQIHVNFRGNALPLAGSATRG
jgi:hypothetical protein